MPNLENNTHIVYFPAESTIRSCTSNSGRVNIGDNARMGVCENNTGKIYIGKNSFVRVIRDNKGEIYLEKGSTVAFIIQNSGQIYFGPNCRVFVVNENGGFIFAGPGSIIPTDRTSPKDINVGNGIIKIWGDDTETPKPTKAQEVGKEMTCAICDETSTMVAFKCGHICCHSCSEKLVHCHNCRAPITDKIKLYF